MNEEYKRSLDSELAKRIPGYNKLKNLNGIPEFIKLYTKGEIKKSIPTIDEAGSIAAGLCENLPEKEQAYFIAGFIECTKYLNNKNENSI